MRGDNSRRKVYVDLKLVFVVVLFTCIIFGLCFISIQFSSSQRTKNKHNRFYVKNDLKYGVHNVNANTFRCSGTCVCEKETKRRSVASSVIGKGMTTLVGGISVYFAIRSAQKRMEYNCEQRYGEFCSEGKITSQVFDCSEVAAADEVLPDEKPEDQGLDESDNWYLNDEEVNPDEINHLDPVEKYYERLEAGEEVLGEAVYKCSGSCLMRDVAIDQNDEEKVKETIDTCKKLKLVNEEVKVDVYKIREFGPASLSDDYRAKKEFVRRLAKFCEKESDEVDVVDPLYVKNYAVEQTSLCYEGDHDFVDWLEGSYVALDRNYGCRAEVKVEQPE